MFDPLDDNHVPAMWEGSYSGRMLVREYIAQVR